MKILGVIACFLVFISTSANAIETKGVVSIGYEFGGDEVVKVLYTNGTTCSIYAGQGVLFSGGVSLLDFFPILQPIALDLQMTVGTKWDKVIEAENGSGKLLRFPMEALFFLRLYGIRLGVGPTYHFANSFTGTGIINDSYAFEYSNHFGWVYQANYLFHKNIALSLRYTSIQYKNPSKPNADIINGSSVGLNVSFFFL